MNQKAKIEHIKQMILKSITLNLVQLEMAIF